MGASPLQAGPGDDLSRVPEGTRPGGILASSPPVVTEAAGPAGPRLRLEEVGTRTGPDFAEVEVALTLSGHRFAGRVRREGANQEAWRIAAAASVGAIQQYLQQRHLAGPTPRVQLLDTTLQTTSFGQEVVHATIRLAQGDRQVILLGSALVRSDRCSTAAAAALDAVQRQLQTLTRSLRLTPDARPGKLAGGEGPVRLPVTPCLAESAHADSRSAPRPSPDAEPTSGAALALHLTPSALHAAVVDEAGRLMSEAHHPGQPSLSPQSLLSLAVESCREAMLARAGGSPIPAAVGLALSGKADGDLTAAGAGAAWPLSLLVGTLAREFNLQVHPIGETAAIALAEARLGAARTLDSLLFLNVGEEIEAILVRDAAVLDLHQPGHVVLDSRGPRCACGQMGCWQALAGCEALVGRAIKAVTSGTPSALAAALTRGASAVTPALICRLAMSGDAVAREAVEMTGRYLALGLGNLLSLFDPQAVMISAGPSGVRAALRHATELALKSSPRADAFASCVFLSPELGPAAPLLGAAAWATLRNGSGATRVSKQ